MSYLERVSNAYRDSMMNCGVSEDVINFCLYSFETGFMAGTLNEEDITRQQDMVKSILNEDNLM